MEKSVVRKIALKNIRKSIEFGKISKDKRASFYLQTILKNINFRSILFYLPMSHEIDLKPIMKQYRKNKKLYIPFMEDVSFKMVAYRLPLRRASFGILEAGYSIKTPNKVDVMVVPVIAVDNQMGRVGFGKGMYDRFITTLKTTPTIIFIQTELCFFNKKLTQEYDIKGDFLITPRGIYNLKSESNDNRGSRYRRSGWHSNLVYYKKDAHGKVRHLFGTGQS